MHLLGSYFITSTEKHEQKQHMEARLGDTSAKKNFPCVKNNFWRIFGTQRNLKACCSASIYKENISNIWYIGKQLCWLTTRTTKKFSRRTCAVKLLTMSCNIKVRHSFLETENESELQSKSEMVDWQLYFFKFFCRFVVVGSFSNWSLQFAELSNLRWRQLFNDLHFAYTVSRRWVPFRVTLSTVLAGGLFLVCISILN